MTQHFILCAAMITASSLIAGLTALHAQPAKHSKAAGQPTEHGAVLVELFTSEGCSSCPPADALLRKVAGKRSDAGQLIVGVSEHVTYWNQLGWFDPFSGSAYTERQNAYGERFHLDSVYTPQMVIDGAEQIVGSDSASLLRAIQKEGQQPHLVIHIVFAILADDTASSNVLHGENAGRTLSHVSVAKTITRLGTLQAETERNFHVLLSSAVQLPSGQGRHLILFAQEPGLGRVLGVDTKPL